MPRTVTNHITRFAARFVSATEWGVGETDLWMALTNTNETIIVVVKYELYNIFLLLIVILVWDGERYDSRLLYCSVLNYESKPDGNSACYLFA